MFDVKELKIPSQHFVPPNTVKNGIKLWRCETMAWNFNSLTPNIPNCLLCDMMTKATRAIM